MSAVAPLQHPAASTDPSTVELFRRWRDSGDDRARADIIARHAGLAEAMARRYRASGESLDDLVQVAYVGLLSAVERFDADRGVEFSSFAVPTIVGELKRHFRDHRWAVHVPRRVKQLHVSIGAVSGPLTQRLGRTPTSHELADELGVDPTDIAEAMAAGNGYRPSSLDEPGPTATDGAVEYLGQLDPSLGAVDERLTVTPLLAALPERHRIILRMRFFDGLTQAQIAELLGMSQVHVSRLLSRSLETLRRDAQA